eukprot:s2710_g6.t1
MQKSCVLCGFFPVVWVLLEKLDCRAHAALSHQRLERSAALLLSTHNGRWPQRPLRGAGGASPLVQKRCVAALWLGGLVAELLALELTQEQRDKVSQHSASYEASFGEAGEEPQFEANDDAGNQGVGSVGLVAPFSDPWQDAPRPCRQGFQKRLADCKAAERFLREGAVTVEESEQMDLAEFDRREHAGVILDGVSDAYFFEKAL